MALGVTGLILAALKALYIAFTGTDNPYIPESVEAKPSYRAVKDSKL